MFGIEDGPGGSDHDWDWDWDLDLGLGLGCIIQHLFSLSQV